MTNAKATSFADGMLTVEAAGSARSIACDSVVLAVGYAANRSLYEELEFDISELYLLGDARNVANIMYGIWDAFEVASHI